MHVVGFTQEVPKYMACSDFFIGKPGPGSISEAIAMKLPVVIERNAWTLPQERYNADWVLEKGVGIVLNDFKKFLMRGNIVDLAVAVVIGAAFGGVITSLVDNVISPIIGLVGGQDFSSLVITLKDATATEAAVQLCQAPAKQDGAG